MSNVIISSIDPKKVLKNLTFYLSTKFVSYINIYMVIDIDDLAYFVCYDCGNSFFAIDLPLGINDPCFCPYCGVDFNKVIENENTM